MPGRFDCGFEFEKGYQPLICMHNKASSVAALCGHNPNSSAFAMRSSDTAAIPSSVAEIFDDDFAVLHGCEVAASLGFEHRDNLPMRTFECYLPHRPDS